MLVIESILSTVFGQKWESFPFQAYHKGFSVQHSGPQLLIQVPVSVSVLLRVQTAQTVGSEYILLAVVR